MSFMWVNTIIFWDLLARFWFWLSWSNRDFAYVARDRITRKHMCHVFRCDIPARTIANTLRDICKKIMIERSLQQNLAKPIDIIGKAWSRLMPYWYKDHTTLIFNSMLINLSLYTAMYNISMCICSYLFNLCLMFIKSIFRIDMLLCLWYYKWVYSYH